MRKPLTLAAKLGLIGTALLLLGLASIGLTLWMTWQLEGGAAAVNEPAACACRPGAWPRPWARRICSGATR
jgi:hypothetical protein